MRKIRLDLDSLEVETFVTTSADGAVGTVRGRDASDYTQCYGGCGGTVDWGACGGESQGAFGCGGGTEEGCTYDVYNDNCYSYAQQCPMTVYPSATCYGTCGAPAGNSVCGAWVCTAECTV